MSDHKLLTILLASGYFFAVSLPHRAVSSIFDWLAKEFSFRVYNSIIFVACLLVIIFFFAVIFVKIMKGDRSRLKIACWFFTIFLLVSSYETIMTVNIECIHYLQYALLALPVFALVGRYGETVFWTTVLGSLDEAYQYFVLYRDNNEVYFDFNDIILNLIGAGIGVLILVAFFDKNLSPSASDSRPSRKWNGFPISAACAIILFGALFLYIAGLLQFYPEANASGSPIILSRKAVSAKFWEEPKRGKRFHILNPIEGTLVISILLACYGFMDYKNKANGKVQEISHRGHREHRDEYEF